MKNAVERVHPVRRPRDHAGWSRTKTLLLVMLGLWIVHFLMVHMFIAALNKVIVPILGFPLGFYLAVQGSLIVFAVTLFWFARQQVVGQIHQLGRKTPTPRRRCPARR